MIDLISDAIAGLTWRSVLIGTAIFLVTFAISLGTVSLILVKLPADYFRNNHHSKFWVDRPHAVRMVALVFKNLLGVLLILMGIIMSLPGVPGQGLLTILLGVMLVDFPGKHRLEQKLLHRPAIKNSIDRLRARFGKAPLELD
ncbi:MAG TPA: hypothetical protein VFZ22_19570 [Pyrinomonadaceae bacterium]|nr:hypothetical protein [Pyrinomonadaceae bacterium]